MPIYAKRTKLFRETAGATVADLNFHSSARKLLKLTANTTITGISGGTEGEELLLLVQQDATGSRTVTWPATVVWLGGAAPTLQTGVGSEYDADAIKLIKVGSIYVGQDLGGVVLTADL